MTRSSARVFIAAETRAGPKPIEDAGAVFD